MISFVNWRINASKDVLAQQFDCHTCTLEVVGDVPDGYTCELLIRAGGNEDVLLMDRTERGLSVTLTDANLCVAGAYDVQIRGTAGDGVVKHTNVLSGLIVPESLTGNGEWPEVPSAWSQVEQRLLEINGHPATPGENGYWLVWDVDAGEYVESEIAMPDYKGEAGDVMFATFSIDPETGLLIMETPDDYDGAQFRINENGFLEVVVNA